MNNKPRFYVVRAAKVCRGDRISIRKAGKLFSRNQKSPKIYYVARNEGPHPAFGYHILWLLNPLEPTKEAIRWVRRPDERVLVERPF